MSTTNIHQLKSHLSEYLAEVKAGGTVIVCERNKPIAEIHRIDESLKTPRPLGLGKGDFEIPAAFFDPLPEDILKAFEGKDE